MEYEITVDKEIEKEINITVPSSELDRLIDEEINKIRKDFTLKGFRKGKVPKKLIKNRYRDTLKAQAITSLANESFFKILAEKKWHPASDAQLLNVQEGENIKFQLRVEVIPDFDVSDYLGLEIFKEEPLPDEFLLEQAKNDLRERHATINEVFRAAVVDDFVTVDLTVKENGIVKTKQYDYIVKIGDRNLLDEINRTLVGIRKSENKKIKIKNQIYEIFVKKIEEKIFPQIDDNFAKKQNYKNIKQLEEKLMASAKKNEERRLEETLKESLSKTILGRIKFMVPKSLIQYECQKILRESGLTDSDTNKENFWDIAEKRARLNLILKKIAEKENVNVEENEIMNLISAMELKLTDENRRDIINYVSDILKRGKTIDFLFKNAKIIEKGRIISPRAHNNALSSKTVINGKQKNI